MTTPVLLKRRDESHVNVPGIELFVDELCAQTGRRGGGAWDNFNDMLKQFVLPWP